MFSFILHVCRGSVVCTSRRCTSDPSELIAQLQALWKQPAGIVLFIADRI